MTELVDKRLALRLKYININHARYTLYIYKTEYWKCIMLLVLDRILCMSLCI